MGSFNVKRMAKTALILVVLAAVVGGGKKGYDYLREHGPLIAEARQLDNRLEAAKNAGLATSPEEIDTPDRVKGFERFEEFAKLDEFLRKHRDVIENDRDRAGLVNLMKENPDQLALLVKAAEIENVNMPIEWEKGIANHPPDYNLFNRYANVACALAIHNSDQGNIAEANKLLLVAAKTTVHLLDEPVSPALVSWAACSNRILRTAYGMLETNPRNAEVLQGVRAALALIDPPKSLAQNVKGDCLLFLETAKHYDSMPDEKRRALQLSDENKRLEPPQGRFAGSALQSKTLKYWIDSMASATPESGNVQDAGYIIDELGAQWVFEDHPANYLAGALPMTYEQAGVSIMRVSQIKNLVLTTASILSSWQQHGALPKQLPDDPANVDPMTGKPLFYKPASREFVLQAIGERELDKVQPPIGNLRLIMEQGYGLTFNVGA